MPPHGYRQKQYVLLVQERRVRSPHEAAEVLGVTLESVRNYARQTGVTISGPAGRRRGLQDEFLQLVDSGRVKSLREAARVLGLSRHTISKYAKECGVTLRGKTGRAVGSRLPKTIELQNRLRGLVEGRQLASKAEAGRLLGIPKNRVAEIAREAGLDIPYHRPPGKQTVPVCSRCGRGLTVPRDDGLCFRCRGAKVEIACTSCGKRRSVYPSAKTLKTGLCRKCWTTDMTRCAAERRSLR